MENSKKIRLLYQMLIQLSPYYLYFCILLFVMSGGLPIFFLKGMTNFLPFTLIISMVLIESGYAYFHNGHSLSEELSGCEFIMNEPNLTRQMFRIFILEGIIPYGLVLFTHTWGYIAYILINELSRYLHPSKKTLIEVIMQGEWAKKINI